MNKIKAYRCVRCGNIVQSDGYPTACNGEVEKDGKQKKCACGQWIRDKKYESKA